MTPNLELARLVGSYHAHRGACDEREFLQWWDSLTHTQRGQVMWYQRDGVAIFDHIAQHHQMTTKPKPPPKLKPSTPPKPKPNTDPIWVR